MEWEFRNEAFTDFTVPQNQEKMKEALRYWDLHMGKKYPAIIGGKEIYTEKVFLSLNPSEKEQVIGEFPLCGPEEAEKAIQVAWEAYQTWKEVPYTERAILMRKAAQIARKKKYLLSAAQVLEVGKNWAEADADVAEGIDYLEFYAREMLRWGEPQPLTPYPGEHNELYYIPIGPVVVIPPWNFPFAILAGMTTAALVCGNSVVLKPASDSPLCGYLYTQILLEAGIPEGVLNFVPGPGGSTGGYLVRHPRTRMIAFTGSKDVGVWIYEEAGKIAPGQIWLKRVIAEMGGKDAIVVDEEAPLEDAANAVVVSAFGFQGQKCSACSRLIVVEKVYDELLEMVKTRTEALQIGPARENYPIGPVINQSAKEKILHYIEIGKKEARWVTGGEEAGDKGFYIKPAIFAEVPPDARIAQEEIFGPVLSVIRAKDFQDAIRIANNSIYGLTGSVFTRNRQKIAYAKQHFFCGNLYINRKCTGAM
ncbi:MAG: L-glutamate gamma-semialdehyde dehydrogenase, partial [bacterium]